MLFMLVKFSCKKKSKIGPDNLNYHTTDISKIKEVLVLKGIFSERTYLFVLMCKFQVSSLILTSFTRGGGIVVVLSPTAERAPQKPPRLGVRYIFMGAELHNNLLFLISIARRKNLIQEVGMEKSMVSP